MCRCAKNDWILISRIINSWVFCYFIFFFDSFFNTQKNPDFFYLAKNTSPKAPLPKRYFISKFYTFHSFYFYWETDVFELMNFFDFSFYIFYSSFLYSLNFMKDGIWVFFSPSFAFGETILFLNGCWAPKKDPLLSFLSVPLYVELYFYAVSIKFVAPSFTEFFSVGV